MNIGDLSNRLAGRFNLSQEKSQAIVGEIFDEIKRFVNDGGHVAIRRFGTFKLVQRKTRTARNPKTGAPVVIPARRVWKFIASKWDEK